MSDYYNYDDEEFKNSIENGDLLDSLPLEKGCENHASTMSSLSFFYPSALGQPLWTPECRPENPTLYQSVQCRAKQEFQRFTCTGRPLKLMTKCAIMWRSSTDTVRRGRLHKSKVPEGMSR